MPSTSPLLPNWPAPPYVRAVVTTRVGGVSREPYESLNLGVYAGDDPQAVEENRRRVAETLALPEQPRWLAQCHGNDCVPAAAVQRDATRADAAWSAAPGIVCAVLIADCLPVLLCDEAGGRIAAVHAGWRGLAGGVVDAAVAALAVPGERLMAWLGPAIGPNAFEVGDEVRRVFMDTDAGAAECFRTGAGGRWLADLYGLARRRLAARGVTRVYGGGWCTFHDGARFYSYRRDGATGRMAALVWLAQR